MKPSAVLAAAVAVALLATSATAWPFYPPRHIPIYPPHPYFPPHPFFPFPPAAGSAPAPSSGPGGFPSLPPPSGDMTKCMQAMQDAGAASCSPLSYEAGKCCTHLSGLKDSCTYFPYYRNPIFQGIVRNVCAAGSTPAPPATHS